MGTSIIIIIVITIIIIIIITMLNIVYVIRYGGLQCCQDN